MSSRPLLSLFSCHKTVSAQCHIMSSRPLLSLFSCHKTVTAQCHITFSPPLFSLFSCHKIVTAQCHIISSPLLLFLFSCHKTVTAHCHIILSPPFLSSSPAHFFIHSNLVTSHWSVLITVHLSPHTLNTQYLKRNWISTSRFQITYFLTLLRFFFVAKPTVS